MNKYNTVLQEKRFITQYLFLSIFILLLGLNFFKANDLSAAERISYSMDSSATDNSKNDNKTVLNQTVFKAPELKTNGEREIIATVNLNNRIYIGDLTALQQSNAVSVNHSFLIFDASVELLRDDDADGYYQSFRVNFDADVDYGSAIVYARMFISFEGGPWNHYYTTKTFEIISDDKFDSRTVNSAFSVGYPPGSYDIRIDLYEAGWTGRVAVYGPNEDYDLNYLYLEDQEYDSIYYYEESYGVVYDNGGCTLNTNSKFDPVFPAMFLLSLLYFFKRFKLRKQKLFRHY